MHSDWVTENVNKLVDWSKTKFCVVARDNIGAVCLRMREMVEKKMASVKKFIHLGPIFFIVRTKKV